MDPSGVLWIYVVSRFICKSLQFVWESSGRYCGSHMAVNASSGIIWIFVYTFGVVLVFLTGRSLSNLRADQLCSCPDSQQKHCVVPSLHIIPPQGAMLDLRSQCTGEPPTTGGWTTTDSKTIIFSTSKSEPKSKHIAQNISFCLRKTPSCVTLGFHVSHHHLYNTGSLCARLPVVVRGLSQTAMGMCTANCHTWHW